MPSYMSQMWHFMTVFTWIRDGRDATVLNDTTENKATVIILSPAHDTITQMCDLGRAITPTKLNHTN